MKKVLVVYYSQTGQLADTVRSFASPMVDADDVDVTFLELEPVKPYPFPWPFFQFLDVFPESVYMDGPELAPLGIPEDAEFDLVVLAYQTWFLSPCLPMTGFLQTPDAKRLLNGKPVVTLIACRNMWLMGQEKLKARIEELGGKLIDNAVLIDQGNSFATFVTTPRWMWTGKKDGFWGFPPAGVADDEIRRASRFGSALVKGLAADEEKQGKALLSGLEAVNVNEKLILSEAAAHRSFKVWGKLLRKTGPQGAPIRKVFLCCYVTFLVTFIATFIPITVLIKAMLYPILKRKLLTKKADFELPSGSGSSRMDEFTPAEC